MNNWQHCFRSSCCRNGCLFKKSWLSQVMNFLISFSSMIILGSKIILKMRLCLYKNFENFFGQIILIIFTTFPIIKGSKWEIYIASLYYIISVVTTTGFGDISVERTSEIILSIIIMISSRFGIGKNTDFITLLQIRKFCHMVSLQFSSLEP